MKSGLAQSVSIFTVEVMEVLYYFDGFPDDENTVSRI
jgi:hypothetical protein